MLISFHFLILAKLQILKYAQKMVWLELQLGRVSHVLAWIEFSNVIASQVLLEQEGKDTFEREQNNQDIVLSMLLLKCDLSNLKWLEFLPGGLDEQCLTTSWYTLLYSLGYEDYLRVEGVIPSEESSESVKCIFQKLLEQPANKDIPEKPNLLLGDKVTFQSFIFGCEVTVEAANNYISLTLAETVLGALEALLATSLDEQVFPFRAELRLRVQPSDFHKGLPEFIVDEATEGEIITIRHARDYSRNTPEERNAFHKWLRQFIVETTLQIIIVSDPDSFAKRIIHDELGLERAINSSDIDIAVSNIFGEAPKFQLSDWMPKEGKQKFTLLRKQPWNFGLGKAPQEPIELQPLRFGEGEPPEELFGIDNLKHKNLRVISLINVPLWDKAQWRAMTYICMPNMLPMIALGFVNVEAAIRIFKGFKDRLGEIDNEERLRLSVITGVNRKHPAYYKVVISSNLEPSGLSKIDRFILVPRVFEAASPNPLNLNNFLERYKQTGKYILLPVCVTLEYTMTEPIWEFGIVKQQLIVREAWQIGRHDPDTVAIHADDDPIIPEDITNAPVIQALQRFNSQKRRKRH